MNSDTPLQVNFYTTLQVKDNCAKLLKSIAISHRTLPETVRQPNVRPSIIVMPVRAGWVPCVGFQPPKPMVLMIEEANAIAEECERAFQQVSPSITLPGMSHPASESLPLAYIHVFCLIHPPTLCAATWSSYMQLFTVPFKLETNSLLNMLI